MHKGDLHTVPAVCKVSQFKSVLSGTSHHAFPVINSVGFCIGLIPKNIIVNLLSRKAFYGDAMIVREEENPPLETEQNLCQIETSINGSPVHKGDRIIEFSDGQNSPQRPSSPRFIARPNSCPIKRE